MKKFLLFAMLLTGLGMVPAAKAQCSFLITNGFTSLASCSVEVQTTYYDGFNNQVTANVLAPNTSFQVNIGTCSYLVQQKVIDFSTGNYIIILAAGLGGYYDDCTNPSAPGIRVDWVSGSDDLRIH